MPANNTRQPTNFGRLFATMARIFQKADPEVMRDLQDSLDVPAFADQWNQSDKGNKPHVDMGSPQAASGSGASRMVSDYADGAEQTGLSEAYEKFARELCEQGKRVESVEKAVSSIAGLLATAMGKGDAAAEMFDAEDEKKEDDEDKEDESPSSKGAIPSVSVPQLMRSLMSASRQTGTSRLATPPNLAVQKASRNTLQDILDADDGTRFSSKVRLELGSIAAAAANVDGGMMRSKHLSTVMGRASSDARQALRAAGIETI
jgi:hypothetical protein